MRAACLRATEQCASCVWSLRLTSTLWVGLLLETYVLKEAVMYTQVFKMCICAGLSYSTYFLPVYATRLEIVRSPFQVCTCCRSALPGASSALGSCHAVFHTDTHAASAAAQAAHRWRTTVWQHCIARASPEGRRHGGRGCPQD